MANDLIKSKEDVENRLRDFMEQLLEEVEEIFWDEFDEASLKEGIDEGDLENEFFESVKSYVRFYKG